MTNKIEAVHNPSGKEEANGVWVFTCYAHPEVKPSNVTEGGIMMLQAVSSPKQSLEVMRNHIDDAHPGERFDLSRSSTWSGEWRGKYTGQRRRKFASHNDSYDKENQDALQAGRDTWSHRNTPMVPVQRHETRRAGVPGDRPHAGGVLDGHCWHLPMGRDRTRGRLQPACC